MSTIYFEKLHEFIFSERGTRGNWEGGNAIILGPGLIGLMRKRGQSGMGVNDLWIERVTEIGVLWVDEFGGGTRKIELKRKS